MNVLISGDLSCFAATFASAFLKERFKVVLVSGNADAFSSSLPGVSVHSVSPATDHFQEIVSAHNFDVVIYLATREEQLLGGSRQNTGEVLDGLLNILELCRKGGIRRLFYISSTEVYGNQELPVESQDPLPASPNGFTLRTGEQYCQYYSQQYGLEPTIVRVPWIYGQGEKAAFLHDLIRKCLDRKKVVFPGPEDTICNFLHAEDVADFILRALDVPGTGYQVVNLSSPDTFTFAQLAELLRIRFPEAKFEYSPARQTATRPAAGLNARRSYDWIAEHKLVSDFPAWVEEIGREPKPKRYLLEKISRRFPRYQHFLKWTEVVLGALAMHYLTVLSGSVIEFRYVDIRFAYVVILGIIYGTQVGLVASGLACLSLLVSWNQSGLSWAELIYNVSTWVPFALYISAGILTGHFHDRKENEIRFQEEQNGLIKEKFQFLHELFQEVTSIKNQFHKQLVGSRDSFGRIYHIARELDTLDEEEVIFKALHILEDVLDNRQIAIYSINQANSFARLEISSSGLGGQINKSMNLRETPELLECILQGETFQNKWMKPGLPAYFVPIKNDRMTVAGVAVWNASFEQHSLYFNNLLSVICGLIQSSINRVALFMSMNLDRYYLPKTRILQPEFFIKVLRVKNKIRKNKLGDYLLVRIRPDIQGQAAQDWEKLASLISGVTRAEDYTGLLGDGGCYILFSQADQANSRAILARLAQRGISCEMVTEQYQLALDQHLVELS
jgi:UDP-glucose 4-epimerase